MANPMRFCENLYCDTPDEPIERISDYRLVDQSYLCIGCVDQIEYEYGSIQKYLDAMYQDTSEPQVHITMLGGE